MWTNFSWHDLTDKQKKVWFFSLGAFGAFVGVILSIVMQTAVEQVKPVDNPPVMTSRPSDVAKQTVLKHMSWADLQVAAGLEPQLAAVKEFFQEARRRTKNYGKTILSWDSKWKLVGDTLSGQKEHARWLQAEFDQTLFNKAELDQLVEQVVSAYLRHTQQVESEMLVRLKADLEQLPAENLPHVVDTRALKATLEQALAQASGAAKADLGATIGKEIASLIAGEVLSMVAAQLAISSGILTAGAGSSWATLGAGIVLSLIADAVISEVYNAQFDPVGKISAKLNEKLSEMEALILNGTEESPGLTPRLQEYSARRNAARRQAVQHALLAH